MGNIKFIVLMLLILILAGCNVLQIKPVEPIPIPPEILNDEGMWSDDLSGQEADDYGSDIEDVGDLIKYTVEIGRNDADIMSKKTYTFYLPFDIEYELMGVDASSSIFEFKKDGQVVFKMDNFDYTRSEDQIDEFWPTADEYSLVGGHTNILQLENDDFEDEMYIFADTLLIDGEAAF